MEHPNGGRVYVVAQDRPMFGVVRPYDGAAATIGNGSMVALAMDSHDQVRDLHARALELGAADEGAPGWRGDPGTFFGAYFRDLDGNKICVYRWGAE
jgi:predicted lactoylglutathione lyase